LPGPGEDSAGAAAFVHAVVANLQDAIAARVDECGWPE
jgi:hypothetical protein